MRRNALKQREKNMMSCEVPKMTNTIRPPIHSASSISLRHLCLKLELWLCNYATASSVTELLGTSTSCDILHLMSTWTAPLCWQSAWREFGRMNPLILELLSVFAL